MEEENKSCVQIDQDNINSIKNKNIVKANEAITMAGFKLNLVEQRLILSCISQIESKKTEVTENDIFLISQADYSSLFDVEEKTARRELKLAVNKLWERSIMYQLPHETEPMETRWISARGVYDEGQAKICFSSRVLPFLKKIKDNFTQYPLRYISQMKSVYSIQLYELLKKNRIENCLEISYDNLRVHFNIEPTKYKKMKDFKVRVLNTAIQEINDSSDLTVKYDNIKNGRSIVGFYFEFKLKEFAIKDEILLEKLKKENKPKGYLSEKRLESMSLKNETYGEAYKRLRKIGYHFDEKVTKLDQIIIKKTELKTDKKSENLYKVDAAKHLNKLRKNLDKKESNRKNLLSDGVIEESVKL